MKTEKETKEEMIERLIRHGFSRWTKGTMDRMYINADKLGLEYTTYNTGNISSAKLDGEKISNSKAYRLLGAKTYLDLHTMTFHGTNDKLLERAMKLAEITYTEVEE